jgi:type IV pilus assembly protein PilO
MGPAKVQLGKSKREKTLLTWLVVAVFVVAYFHFLIRPVMLEMGELLPKVATLRRDLAYARDLIANKSVIIRQRDRLRETMDEYEKILPREREIPKLLENLSSIAGEFGVKIVGVRPIGRKEYEPKTAGEIYQEIPIEVVAVSGYHALGKFLEKLETGERFIMINDLEITANDDNMARHNITLIASTFVLTAE